MVTSSTADIRPYLTSAYSDEEITALCADYFRDVRDNFTVGMTKARMIELLLDYCLRRESFPNLLAALQKDRPEQYRRQFGPVAVEAGPAPAPLIQPAVLNAKAQPAKPASAPSLPNVLTIESPIRLELVRVPAGEFLMGSDPAKDKQAWDDEKPQHHVHVPEFYVGKYPVTNDQYAVFVQAAKHAAPEHWANGQIPPNKGNHPVVKVTWEDAVAFCDWLCQATGQPIRLPTEAEWEKAARGIDGRIYPWGNQAPDKTLCNFGRNVGDTTPVGQYLQGVSPFGALDMAGNVWELAVSLFRSYPYQPDDGRNAMDAGEIRVVRGGSCFHDARAVRCAVRYGDDPYFFLGNLGFRVVAAPFHS